MTITPISTEAKRINDFVHQKLNKNLPDDFLQIITLILDEPELTNVQIMQKLFNNCKLNRSVEQIKSCFNDNKYFIEKAIFEAEKKSIKVRKKGFKNTMNRYIFKQENSNYLIGIFSRDLKDIENFLGEQSVPISSKKELANHIYKLVELCEKLK